jgi:hypothetical protein
MSQTHAAVLAVSVFTTIVAAVLPFLPASLVGWPQMFIVESLVAPVMYVIGVTSVWSLTKGSRRVLWLLMLAPLAFWRVVEFGLVMMIWTLRGGIV